MDYRLGAILIAFFLDLILGDPQWQWHPVRILGRLIKFLEIKLNTGKNNRKFCGIILVILVIGLTTTFVGMILWLTKLIHPFIHFIILILSTYFVISVKSLVVEANKVKQALDKENIEDARRCISMIVGRDTQNLSQTEIIRATVETVAESIMDGIVAPLFYVFLGGPILAWAYKTINTLDSMVGYRSERFIDFGMATAKLDGYVNFIPAKITTLLITLSAAFFIKDSFLRSMKWTLRYLFKGPKDNSEATESAMAGALEVQLGGLNFYQSVPIQKRLIGDNLHPLHKNNIKDSIKIVYLSSVLCITLGLILNRILY